MPACVSIRQHASACVYAGRRRLRTSGLGRGGIRQHASACGSARQQEADNKRFADRLVRAGTR
jgi:hypothetical protein